MGREPSRPAGGGETVRVSVRLPESHIRALDQLVDQGRYASRSEAIRTALRKKRSEWETTGDSVARFIAECVRVDPEAPRQSTRQAYEHYVEWCKQVGEEPVSQLYFTNTLKQEPLGYGWFEISGRRQRGYENLGFTDQVPESDPPE